MEEKGEKDDDEKRKKGNKEQEEEKVDKNKTRKQVELWFLCHLHTCLVQKTITGSEELQ